MPQISFVQLFATLLLYAVWVYYTHSLLHSKFSKYRTMAIAGGMFIAVAAIDLFLIPPAVGAARIFVSAVALAAVVFLLYADPPARKALILGCVLTAAIMTDAIMMIWVPRVTGIAAFDIASAQPLYVQIVYSASNLALNLLLLFASTFFTNRENLKMSRQDFLMFILFPFSQLILLAQFNWGAFEWDVAARSMGYIFSILLCLVVDFLLFRAMRGMAQRAELQAQNEHLAKQIDLQKKHQASVNAQQEKIRDMQRDIVGHVQTIQDLLNSQQAADALQYTSNLVPQYTRAPSASLCDNPIVDALLLGKLKEASRLGIRVTTEVHIPLELGISNVDLVGAFANLFDNAIEACAAVGEADRWITLHASLRAGFLLVEMQNAMHADSLYTQKGSDRGLGTYILQDIAKRYQGEFVSTAQEDRFVAKLVLQATKSTL